MTDYKVKQGMEGLQDILTGIFARLFVLECGIQVLTNTNSEEYHQLVDSVKLRMTSEIDQVKAELREDSRRESFDLLAKSFPDVAELIRKILDDNP